VGPLSRLRSNIWADPRMEGHGFTGCGKTHVLYQGTTLVVP
jgi:hypothetical protein